MSRSTLSLSEARRIALAAQGFDRPRPRKVSARDLGRVIRQLGLVQIDTVNVLARAHYQVPFSRLGPYKKSVFDDVVYRSREFTEQWAHEASIVPVASWPLLRHRMETHRVRPWPFAKFMEEQADYVGWVAGQVQARGPLTANDLPVPDGVNRTIPEAWGATVPKATLEAHFGRGILAVAARRPDFSRVYDLAERIIPREHHSRNLPREEAQRELLRLAARSHGIGTAADLADYYRMPVREARPRIAELAEAGELCEVRVESWREAAFLHRDAQSPRRIDAATLLSPFDPVVWFRPRAARLFAFDYTIEIYLPREKRTWGYYVLPFLLGDRLVARVDLKADRDARRLLVPAAYIEAGAKPVAVAEALARELRTMADWLDLDSVVVERGTAFARKLAAAAGGLRRAAAGVAF
jgi:uncharacterized protein YcaQ